MGKVVIFDWGGVIMHKHPVDNNDRQAIIRTIRSFNSNLTDEEAWDVYVKTLIDENDVYISAQDDELSKIRWVDRINRAGNFNVSVDEFSARFIAEHLTLCTPCSAKSGRPGNRWRSPAITLPFPRTELFLLEPLAVCKPRAPKPSPRTPGA